MAFCIKCGEELPHGAKFCANCGTPVSQNHGKSQAKREQEYAGKIIKCPACGEALPSLTAICPACGHEINSATISESLRKFIEHLDNCDFQIANSPETPKKGWGVWSKGQRFWWVVINLFFWGIPLLIYLLRPLLRFTKTSKLTRAEKEKKSLIENYVFPNERGSILEALLFIKSKTSLLVSGKINGNSAFWIHLWTRKAEQLYQSAELLFAGDRIAKDAYQKIVNNEKKCNRILLIRFLTSVCLITVAVSMLFTYRFRINDIGNSKHDDTTAKYDWPQNKFTAVIPKPGSEYGQIQYEYTDSFSIDIYKVSESEFDSYTNSCREKGFDNDLTRTSSFFSAETDDGFSLMLYYFEKEDKMSLHISRYNAQQESTSATDEEVASAEDISESPLISETEASPSTEVDYSEFAAGYKKADFFEYNSSALGNEHADTRIYFECKLDKTEILEADGTKSILGYVTDIDGNEWLIQLHIIPIVVETSFDRLIGQPVVLKGMYLGYSGAKEMPFVVLDEILVKETGEIISGMQKLLDE